MKIYVVGSSKNEFLQLDSIREKFLIDKEHNGDNLDILNPWFCEITALYYLWKNCNDDIVGLEHYRRYFLNDQFNLLNENEIKNILKDNDIICIQEKENYNIPLFQRFERGFEHGPLRNELIYLIETFNELYPNQSEDLKEFLKNKTHYQFNMLICKKELLNKYCEWLFPILKNICDNAKTLTKRSIGFLAEIVLFSYYFTKVNPVKIYTSNYRIQNFKKIEYR